MSNSIFKVDVLVFQMLKPLSPQSLSLPSLLPPPRFTLRQLHYFIAVVRHGQISAAAAHVGLSQSAMTLSIADLEQSVGVSLLERGRQGVGLTLDGRAFYEHAQRVLETAEDAARFPFQLRNQLTGTIRLAASYTVLGYLLLPALARFQLRYPDIRIELEEQTRTVAEQSMQAGTIDVAVLLLSNMGQREDFHTQVLARSRRQLWVAPEHALTGLGSVSFEDMVPFPFIDLEVDEGDRNTQRYWQEAGLQPVRRLRTTSMEAVREMVALGLGITILSDMVYRPLSLEGRRIQALPVNARLPVMEVGLAWPKGAPLTPCAEALRDFLARTLGTEIA